MTRSTMTRRFLVVALTLLPVVAAYWQVGGHAFVNWDDDAYVYGNPQVRGGLTLEGVTWAFASFHASNWHPLTWLSHMADVSMFGMDAGWHHRVNVLFHVANTALLFLLLRSMTGAVWRSALAAAIFGAHPLHVESVAWVAERKDVLSALFWLLATASYVRYARQPGVRRYAAVVLLFALGLLSKPMVVTLPFTLLLLDWWPLRRLSREGGGDGSPGPFRRAPLVRLVAEKAPLLAMSAVSAVVAYAAQERGGAVVPWTCDSPGARIGNAIVSCATYLAKTVWPSSLAASYPSPDGAPGTPAWQVAVALLLLGAVSCAALRNGRRRPWLAAGWLWYLGTLVPVIGLVRIGDQALADRYTYVPQVGLLVLIVWEASERLERWRVPRAARALAGAVAVSALAAGSWVQAGYWRDGVTLFGRAVEVAGGNPVAHNNLGSALVARGRADEAVAHYRKALEIRPDYAEPRYNLGVVLADRGETDEAIVHYREALRIRPDHVAAHNNLATLLARRGRLEEAATHLKAAIRLDPQYAEAHSNLGMVFAAAGRYPEAIDSYREAVRLDPGQAIAHNNLGIALVKLGRFGEAAVHLREAIRIRPDLPDAHNNLGVALAALGDVEGAVARYREAIRIRPGFAEARANLAKALEVLERPGASP